MQSLAHNFFRITPVHYDLSLYDLELGGSFTFRGTVTIELEVQSPVKEIILNAHQLQLETATLSNHDGTSKMVNSHLRT